MFLSRFCLVHLHFVYSCAGAVHFMRRSKFTKVQKDGGRCERSRTRAPKTMSLLKQMLPTQDVTEHEMNFRPLFPFFFLLLKESLRKYYWPKSKPTSLRAMICLGTRRRRPMSQSQTAIGRSEKETRRTPPLEMVSLFLRSTFAGLISLFFN